MSLIIKLLVTNDKTRVILLITILIIHSLTWEDGVTYWEIPQKMIVVVVPKTN